MYHCIVCVAVKFIFLLFFGMIMEQTNFKLARTSFPLFWQFKRTEQKSNPKPWHGLYNEFLTSNNHYFVISSYHGNVSSRLFGPTFWLPALITKPVFWTTTFGIRKGKYTLILRKFYKANFQSAKVENGTFSFSRNFFP